jgi:uncharacterized protein (DUF305 family)
VASATLVAALSACGSDNGTGHGAGHETSVSAGASASPRQGDIVFAQGMIPHHEQAVEMADVALAHPDVSADVKELATAVKGAQDPEIKQMQGWLQEWGAPATATGAADPHAGHGMMTGEDMTALEAAKGDEFNRMWMSMMIEHHSGAITMAEDVLETSEDAAVKSLAEAIVTAQKAEIEQMKKLLG